MPAVVLGQSVARGAATPTVGALVQAADVTGCLRDGAPDCTPGTALDGAQAVVVSPDGRHAYAVATEDSAVTAYARDAAGALTQVGCVAPGPIPGCTVVRGLGGVYTLALSPDGRSAYAVSAGHDAVVVLRRDPRTGTLTQPEGPAGCVADGGAPPPVAAACTPGRGLDLALGVAVSPDGSRVYATSMGDDALVVLRRERATGALTQEACFGLPTGTGVTADGCTPVPGLRDPQQVAVGDDHRGVALGPAGVASFRVDRRGLHPAGCLAGLGSPMAGDCGRARGLGVVSDVVLSSDGAHAYTAGGEFPPAGVPTGEGLAVLSVDRTTAALSQPAGAAGCLVAGGHEGCAPLRAADDVYGLGLSPDGRNVYAGSYGASALLVLDRDRRTGALRQPDGPAGCLAAEGSAHGCATARHLGGVGYGPGAVAVSPDGRSVYAAAHTADALVTLRRADGSVPGARPGVTIASDARVTTPGWSVVLTGRALDQHRRPVAGARVRVLRTAWGDRTPTPVATTRTDGDGRWRAVVAPTRATRYAADATAPDGTALRGRGSTLVRVGPRVAVAAQPSRRHATVHVRVATGGACVPVTVSRGGRVLDTGTAGCAPYGSRLRLAPGRHVLDVTTPGVRGLLPAAAKVTVVVR